jgi:Cu+-exporting ATPase
MKVAMLGDGLNDAGALKQSNVGLPLLMTPTALPLLRCDYEWRKSGHFGQIPECMQRLDHNCENDIYNQFLYNIVGLSYAVTGHMHPLLRHHHACKFHYGGYIHYNFDLDTGRKYFKNRLKRCYLD